jgi:hypothetical protein
MIFRECSEVQASERDPEGGPFLSQLTPWSMDSNPFRLTKLLQSNWSHLGRSANQCLPRPNMSKRKERRELHRKCILLAGWYPKYQSTYCTDYFAALSGITTSFGSFLDHRLHNQADLLRHSTCGHLSCSCSYDSTSRRQAVAEA